MKLHFYNIIASGRKLSRRTFQKKFNLLKEDIIQKQENLIRNEKSFIKIFLLKIMLQIKLFKLRITNIGYENLY